MNKYSSEFKLPSVHFATQIDEHQRFTPMKNKLKNVQKYKKILSKSITRSRSDIQLPSIPNKQYKQHIQSKRRKSRMMVMDMYKQNELDDEKIFMGSMEERYTKKLKQFRKKYYNPEKIKQSLNRIKQHKNNIEEIGCDTLRQKCFNLIKYSIFNDPLIQFYKGQLAHVLILDQIYNNKPVRYEIAQQIIKLQQKLNQALINYKQKQINDVVQNIDDYQDKINQLRNKFILFSHQRAKTESQQISKTLQLSNANNLIRGFRLQQQNIAQRINRNQKQLGKLIKNNLLISQSMIITKKYEMLKHKKMKTQIE